MSQKCIDINEITIKSKYSPYFTEQRFDWLNLDIDK